MLIVGGLIGVGIVALLIAVLLIRSEGNGKPDPAQQEDSAKRAELAEALPASQNGTYPAVAQVSQANHVTVLPEQGLIPLVESEHESAMRGQVQELSSQLRILHKQASDLEQHLGQISAAFEQAVLHEHEEQPTLVGMPTIQRSTRPFKG